MIIMTGGGTGGHIYPGIALAEALKKQGYDVTWLGADGGLEKTLVPKAGIPLTCLRMSALRQGGYLAKLLALWRLGFAILAARRLYRRTKPSLVIAMGGYASTAGGIAATLAGVPLVLHEQNAAPGMSNRLLSHLAKKIFCAFPDSFTGNKVSYVGNPVRRVFSEMPAPALRFDARSGAIRLLVLGGSQGARVLNETVPQAVADVASIIPMEVIHLAGAEHAASVQAAYAKHSLSAEVMPYHDDIVRAFAWCDLVVSRAGAMTVTEIMHAGVAAILVPLPHAADDHQTKNAKQLVEAGGAILLSQSGFNAKTLAQTFKKICQSRKTLHTMAERSYQLRQVDTEEKMIRACQLWLHLPETLNKR